jgi:hypothetical protein
MSLLEPTPQPRRRNIAAIIATVSAAMMLISIGLCGTHGSGWDSDGPDQEWLSVGIWLFFSSIGGFVLALLVWFFQVHTDDRR